MMIPVHFALFFLWVAKDFISVLNVKFRILAVEPGKPFTLHCTFNCSTPFVRGCWKKKEDNKCLGTFNKTFCTVSLHLSNVTTKDRTYICYTENLEDPQLHQKQKLYIRLEARDVRRDQNWTTAPETETSLPAKPNDSSEGEFTGIKVLATVTVAVATVLAALAAYLCLKRNRQSRNSKGDPAMSRSSSPQPSHSVLQPMKGTQAAQSERVTLRIPPPENGSDTEVPYADIMITVRGVSTPELTQVSYLSAGDQKEWWGEESRSHLQASRSADRLHVPHPREVNRKMSTNSEYAVITYA